MQISLDNVWKVSESGYIHQTGTFSSKFYENNLFSVEFFLFFVKTRLFKPYSTRTNQIRKNEEFLTGIYQSSVYYFPKQNFPDFSFFQFFTINTEFWNLKFLKVFSRKLFLPDKRYITIYPFVNRLHLYWTFVNFLFSKPEK